MNSTTHILVDNYIKSLNEKEYKAYLIAKSHLGGSFSIEKSVGFLQWLKKNGGDVLPSTK